MNARVGGELGMKCGHHMAALLHPNRIAVITGQYGRIRAYLPDDGRADENRFQFAAAILESDVRDAAVDLAAVGVALDLDVHQAEARLRGMGYFAGEQNGARAASVDRLLSGKDLQRTGQLLLIQQLEY